MRRFAVLCLALALACALTTAASGQSLLELAAPLPARPAEGAAAPLHPPVKLLDRLGRSVLESGGPVSAELSCSGCHNAEYIAGHNYHAAAGLGASAAPGGFPGARPWETSPGLYGRFDPLNYFVPARTGIAPQSADEDWLRRLGYRYTGGAAGMLQAAGPYALDCFLCHTENPDNPGRIAELTAGRFAWATTATLSGTGLAARSGAGWRWNAALFQPDGTVAAKQLKLTRARAAHCGACHGKVEMTDNPLTLRHSLQNWSTETTGQVFSPQQISDSGLNLADKQALARAWDVHAERLLECADCHHAPNNPGLYRETGREPLPHLLFDPRRPRLSAYLESPRHEFTKGQSAQGLPAVEAGLVMRGCADCHEAPKTHRRWLPYAKRHMQVLKCEACHIPRIYAPARAATDWTLPTPAGEPRVTYRGGLAAPLTPANVDDPATLLAGYTPALLARRDMDGARRLGPYNLALAWYWVGDVSDAPGGKTHPEPVSIGVLKRAFLDGPGYRAEILAALDTDQNGRLSDAEAVLDSEAKVQAAAGALKAAGVAQPRIQAELTPYDLHHGITGSGFATRDCRACHGRRSILTAPLTLAASTPAAELPQLTANPGVSLAGSLRREGNGLRYVPRPSAAGLYILGWSRFSWGDRLGAVLILLTLLAVLSHGGTRLALRLRRMREARQ